MNALKLTLLLCLALPALSFAQFANTGFFKLGKKVLAFSTAAPTIFEGNCSGMVTVQSRRASGTALNVTSLLPVTLSASATTTYYSDPHCRNSVASISIPNGQSSASFYFITSAVGPNTLTAEATGYQSGSQIATISTNPYVWVGLGGDANWSTGANWSGNSPPPAGQVALFRTCASNCSPVTTANVSIAGIRMESSYTGTITQGSGFTMTIGSMGIVQKSGNFQGGNADISISGGILSVSGGTFTSTSANLILYDSRGGYSTHEYFVVNNPNSFFHNNGLVWFHIASNNAPVLDLRVASNNPFNHVRVERLPSVADDSILSANTSFPRPVILGNLNLANAVIRGTWEVQGNVVYGSGYGYYLGPENAAFFFTGSSNQTIDNTVNVAIPRGLITISKGATSKLTLLSNISLSTGQSINMVSGRIDLGGRSLTVPGTLTMAAGTEIYLNGGTLTVGGASIAAGAYGSGMIYSGAAP